MMTRIKLNEHTKAVLYPSTVSTYPAETHMKEYSAFSSVSPRVFKKKNGKDQTCFQLSEDNGLMFLETNYYIGLDWLVTGESIVQVLPKVNSKALAYFVSTLESQKLEDENSLDEDQETEVKISDFNELNYLKMFLDAMAHPVVADKLDGLILIDWEAPRIDIEQHEDLLTPFLILHFLKLVKDITRKGLKKSYYSVNRQLNSKVKGKILVGEHIKRNIMKHRLTSTFCEYQEFGVDSIENRFLKKVLGNVQHYVNSNKMVFKEMEDTIVQMINFCNPAFCQVSELKDEREFKHFKANPFFREYKEAVRIGNYIIKRFGYNLTDSVSGKVPTPPFWIDMPLLFELYTYSHLLDVFEPNQLEYHHRTYGNELDFLIKKNGYQMVVDAKYKMSYKAGHIHSDIRQVSGYARLKSVYSALGIEKPDTSIDCLIIYPSLASSSDGFDMAVALENRSEIKAYRGIYKLGVPMPWINDKVGQKKAN